MSDAEALRELKNIKKILLLANAKSVEVEISKVASTPARRKMWVRLDGTRSTKQLADELGVSQRGVQVFLKDARTTGLVDLDGELPRRALDYVPPQWLEGEVAGETQNEGVPVEPQSKPQEEMTLDRIVEPESKE